MVPLAGRPLWTWSLSRFALHPEIERLVLVIPAAFDTQAQQALSTTLAKPITFVEGGARRRDSVSRALELVDQHRFVLIHDTARALVDDALITRVLVAARRHGAAIPVVPIGDSLLRGGTQEVARGGIQLVQTPQGFEVETLRRAHRAAEADWDAGDDAAMVRRLGIEVATVEGNHDNFKITWPDDLQRAERLLRGSSDERVGLGWDVHPLAAGRPFLLAGVLVSDQFGPVGHSDGDPLCHAIADALLGAAALGDIGTLFPDTDSRYAGIAGCELLARTVETLVAHGFEPRQVDAVIITDTPKLAPHRDAIRARLAEVLGLDRDAIWLKGKRTEGLGALAGGQGVQCQAIARIARKLP
jgi:2-C-methyl-D-erythritol 4-phosphate cytidylyltransferase/2-C-methyl-D-erythritol 2,4-cyclodiphosphate synthase